MLLKRTLVAQKVSTAACDPGMKGERVSSQTFPAPEKIQGTCGCRGSWSSSLAKGLMTLGNPSNGKISLPKSLLIKERSKGPGMEPLGIFPTKRLLFPHAL